VKFLEKIEVAGNVISLWVFEKAQRSDFSRPATEKKSTEISEKEQAKNRERTLSRARKRYFDLVNLNFASLTKFLTLTIANPVYSTPAIANPALKNFVDKLRKTHDRDLKYIATIELQKRGTIHYHLLMDMKYIDFEVLLKKWGLGGCWIKAIPPECPATANYMAKYMSKQMLQNLSASPEWRHKKVFLRSRNLKYPPLVMRRNSNYLSLHLSELLDGLKFHGEIVKKETYEGNHEVTGRYKKTTIIMDRLGSDIKGVEQEACLYAESSLTPSF
jgi:hypothetical protein